jgi:hypothetical protein
MSNSRINNTYAITATADVNRQCNAEGAAKGGSLGATTDAAMAARGSPSGFLTYKRSDR